MKRECDNCGQKHTFNACPNCGQTSGFLQEPQGKVTPKMKIELGDYLVHIKTQNIFEVKEIQSKGVIAFANCPVLNIKKKKVYISDSTLDEYKKL